jgi:hypothetical protein
MADYELPQDYVLALRAAALLKMVAADMTAWRLLLHVPTPPESKILEAVAVFSAARELAASALRELEEIGLAGPLTRQAQLWQTEGARLIEMAQALLTTKLPVVTSLPDQQT